jgi:hypothetical protein
MFSEGFAKIILQNSAEIGINSLKYSIDNDE